jgi:hypothetical protein
MVYHLFGHCFGGVEPLPFEIALLTLIHVLVFVYWLGGDLGAFYTSRFLTMPGISADRRLLAAKIVGDVDMAPRLSLIATLPTGLALAQASGWIQIGWLPVGAITLAAFLWGALAIHLHNMHGANATLKRVDLYIRYLLIVSIAVVCVLSLTGQIVLAKFLVAKLALLAIATGLGLTIRSVLTPLGPAIGQLSKPETQVDGETALAALMSRAKPLVNLIWVCLILAAFMGLYKPA